MIWLSWRQQRAETVIAAALLALLAVVLIPSGIHLADLFTHEGIARCIGRRTEACNQATGIFNSQVGFSRSLVTGGWLNLIPGLIGAALAAPLLLELENGTVRLAWTQSITRGRWLAGRFGLGVITAVAAGGVLTGLLTWYREPLDQAYGAFDGFDAEGLVPVAYAVFALGLAVAVGVVWRRTAPAIVVSILAYFATRLFVGGWLRQRFMTPLRATWRTAGKPPAALHHAWAIWVGPTDRAGHPFHFDPGTAHACSRFAGSKDLLAHCIAKYEPHYSTEIFQPASRFWEFQGIEFALFAGVAALLLAFAAWRVLRTD
jgi:hypothetical protein